MTDEEKSAAIKSICDRLNDIDHLLQDLLENDKDDGLLPCIIHNNKTTSNWITSYKLRTRKR